MVNEKVGKEKRDTPFTMKCGDLYYVIADGKVFIDSIKSRLEALVLLMAFYFVFNIKYCVAIFSACIFLEHVLLGKIIQKYRPELRLNSQ